MRQRVTPLIVIAVATIFLVGCAVLQTNTKSFVKTSYQTLFIGMETYNSTLQALADLHSRKLITDEQRDKAIELGAVYMKAHNTAVELLRQYVVAEGDDAKLKALASAAVLAVTEGINEFSKYAIPLLLKDSEGKDS